METNFYKEVPFIQASTGSPSGGLIIDPIPESVRELENFVLKLIQNMKPLDPEFSKTVDEHFWELI